MTKHWYALWIGDTHFRTKWSRSEKLYKFLCSNTCDVLFLVGDIVDTYNINTAYVDDYQHKCIEFIKEHPNVFYIMGNHDLHYPQIAKDVLSGVKTSLESRYESLLGKQYLIIHGHQYDPVGTVGSLFKRISIFRRLYSIVSQRDGNWLINQGVNLADYLLSCNLSEFKHRAINDAKARGFDGMVTGHTHVPALEVIDGITYMNPGNWANKSCSALAEDMCGRFHLLWID